MIGNKVGKLQGKAYPAKPAYLLESGPNHCGFGGMGCLTKEHPGASRCIYEHDTHTHTHTPLSVLRGIRMGVEDFPSKSPPFNLLSAT